MGPPSSFTFKAIVRFRMSFELLKDNELEESFAELKRIGSRFEHNPLLRVSDKPMGQTGVLPPMMLGSSVTGGSVSLSGADLNTMMAEIFSSSRNFSPDIAAALSIVGRKINELVDTVKRQTDLHFVSLYDHMKKKEAAELEEICTKRKIMPQGFAYQMHGHGPGTSLGVSEVLEEDEEGIDSVLPVVIDGDPRSLICQAPGPEPNTGRSAPHRNAPLARRLQERRGAASTLQTYLFLILESAISQCDASCAAVFLNGLNYVDPNKPPNLDGIDRDSPPRFLHCVANLHGEEAFPTEISYATLNPLTAVVQTGVAVNLRNTEVPHVPSVDSENRGVVSDDPVTKSLKKNINKVLKINSGIISPIGDFGCVVLANKKSSASVSSFTVSDEHVVWSVSMFTTTILTRYHKDLLLDNGWYPSHIPLLKRFMTLPVVKAEKGESKFPVSHDVETAITSNFGSLAQSLLTFITESKGSNMPRRLTMVRTADSNTSLVVPVELLPRNRTKVAVATQVTEEEIFQGAAQYISNLESLWHKSLAENNQAHLIMQKYDTEIESRNEEIRLLEAKIRKLNTRIVQLERQRGRSISNS